VWVVVVAGASTVALKVVSLIFSMVMGMAV
jgi:hypothetical protein